MKIAAINFRNSGLTIRRRTWVWLALLTALGLAYALCLPSEIFRKPYSSVLQDRDGQLLSATIARDGQWRFPLNNSVPEKFVQAILTFEDKRFFQHPGVDPLSLGRALVQNLREGKVVSGGSTLTMQVIRLSRPESARNLPAKIIEMILATRLELRHSKKEILSLYASHAPFGGNVVGLDAACWRYFGRSPENISWGEATLLAVLPNAPSLIHPGKNRILLREKRDRLLDRLHKGGVIDSMTCLLSKAELLPDQPRPLPRLARHLLARMKQAGLEETRLRSTIEHSLQQRVEDRLRDHHRRLVANRIHNGAVLVLDVRTGRTLAYAGNVDAGKHASGQEVDIITSPRSTGSILKPFLYAAALDEGQILPNTLLPDIPVFMNGFSPENFSKSYDGAVPANQSLIRSLNVPSVFLLRDYRYEKFYTLLKNTGFTTLSKSADHYGLSLILGGAEGSLWDITGMYASMARTLNNYFEHPGKNRYFRSDFHPPVFIENPKTSANIRRDETSWLSASSIYLTFEALKELYRPAEESGWKFFSASKKIAWKTGTSFGFRDGWAIGVTPDYAVGVWVGNADGEGRPGLTGTNAAAPLLFDVFTLLPRTEWFDAPRSEMQAITICRKSGQRISPHCELADTIRVTARGLDAPSCVYHKTIHLSADRKFRVHAGCADIADIVHEKWFLLPPVQEHYYKVRNISYKTLPPLQEACENSSSISPMDLIYPEADARIIVPRDFDGKPGASVFELAHRDQNMEVHWHLDGVFIGTTQGVHRLPVSPEEGRHVLTLVDRNGYALEEHFTVISAL